MPKFFDADFSHHGIGARFDGRDVFFAVVVLAGPSIGHPRYPLIVWTINRARRSRKTSILDDLCDSTLGAPEKRGRCCIKPTTASRSEWIRRPNSTAYMFG